MTVEAADALGLPAGIPVGPGTGDNMGAALGLGLAPGDIAMSLGTSGTVYPAAGFADVAKQAGARTVEINLEATDASPLFDEVVAGPAGETVPIWVRRLLD